MVVPGDSWRALLRGLIAAALVALVALMAYGLPRRGPAPASRRPSAVSPAATAGRSAPAVVPSGARPLASGYPRLANYNGLRAAWQTPFFTQDDLIVGRRGAPLPDLARARSRALTLLYERALQADLADMPALYGIKASDVPSGWWLVRAGSRLAAPMDATQRDIIVADPRPFAACQDVLVGGESMHVRAVRGHMLYVARGYYSAAAPHALGARVAPHYSYRTDLSNCRLSGRGADPRPWSFNLASTCPRYHGQTWADFLAHYVVHLARRQGWRGIFYDNLTDVPPDPTLDVNRDGVPDGGVIDGVDVWRAGQRALLAETRRLAPRVPLLVNGDLSIDGVADGREMEAFPLIPGASLAAAIDAYLYDGAAGLPHSIVNPDSVTRASPSVPAARLAVGVALLGSGYVAYDYGWIDHGYPWWFDEYDRGAGSATSAVTDADSMLVPVVHPARFHPGDVVLIDEEAARVVRVLTRSLLLQRGVLGTVPAWHPPRTTVTTRAQRAAGHGYLGAPLGPAYLVPTAPWARYTLPLSLDQAAGTVAIDGHPARARAAVTDRTALRLPSTMRYAIGATGVALRAPVARGRLRTLTFAARGPAGEQLWLTEGASSVPLVLRGGWHTYTIPVGGVSPLVFGAGRVGGVVEIKGVRLIAAQAFVLRRDFTRGAVIVNPTDVTQELTVAGPYRRLAGDQDPWANTGRPARFVSVARYQAVILVV